MGFLGRKIQINYINLNILAEGQAEREFAQNTLGVYFEPLGILVDSRCVMTSRKKHKKGGLGNYLQAKNDLIRWISEEKGRHPFFTTMFDLYALPMPIKLTNLPPFLRIK